MLTFIRIENGLGLRNLKSCFWHKKNDLQKIFKPLSPVYITRIKPILIKATVKGNKGDIKKL